ncbi:ABC transporter ATP-binding protein [Labrys okinawensis]|uniref:ABC transporter ATP-binding protein n=1 Tax=Labrys okinawensis TaxID=346911 RepID=A0A2S9Q8V1_9HYPH|nr:ABC transporter ATP-binding protein [Labrys okinawensis]PRH85714.1 ABC transporter ATP-binding protein [Labrys okinawensis]
MTVRTDKPALSVSAVGHRFGKREALADVSLEVQAGRFVALLGPNGAGKTTLFSIVTRLYQNRSGRVEVYGHDLNLTPSRALAELGVVFQARTLDADLTVRQNLAYHAALHGLGGRAVREHILALLKRVGLGERADEKVRTLSGGQARRVEIARALVHRPRLLLLDEPTVGLDLAARADIVATVRRLVAEEGIAVLWATHIFEEIANDDDVYVLHRGRIVAEGKAAMLAARSGASLAETFRRLTDREAA